MKVERALIGSRLDMATAARYADIALANVVREYPSKLDHVMDGATDALPPRELHPVFYGSFDWHSCVHMHWLLARVRRSHPGLPQRATIDALFDRHFTTDAFACELRYLQRPSSGSFERTYGWAWLLKLADELHSSDEDRARRWSAALAPLADAFVARYLDYLPRAQYPWRYGLHANSAFALAFALDYARRAAASELAALCEAKAREWYGTDRGAPAAWEPSGADFLSPSLIEAELMRRVEAPGAFAAWLDVFLPDFGARRPETLFTPALVADRADPQIVHLDGLNLSRAWCFRGIAASLPAGDSRADVAMDAASVHLAAGLTGIDSVDYVGSHWLATFATLALTEGEVDPRSKLSRE
jgi:hypothetical protein